MKGGRFFIFRGVEHFFVISSARVVAEATQASIGHDDESARFKHDLKIVTFITR